eukprot:GCRY01005489.1.p1 GENE.GCRY01005489.1~~GCRY01005489.1.p1  ORF type:complete len:954 (+),score=223.97 GCRY01005489.1:151-3012(+)
MSVMSLTSTFSDETTESINPSFTFKYRKFFNIFEEEKVEEKFRIWHWNRNRRSVMRGLLIASSLLLVFLVSLLLEKPPLCLIFHVLTVILGYGLYFFLHVHDSGRLSSLLVSIGVYIYFMFSTPFTHAFFPDENGQLGEDDNIMTGTYTLSLVLPHVVFQCHFVHTFFTVWGIHISFGAVAYCSGYTEAFYSDGQSGMMVWGTLVSILLTVVFRKDDQARRELFITVKRLERENNLLSKRVSVVEKLKDGQLHVDAETRRYLMTYSQNPSVSSGTHSHAYPPRFASSYRRSQPLDKGSFGSPNSHTRSHPVSALHSHSVNNPLFAPSPTATPQSPGSGGETTCDFPSAQLNPHGRSVPVIKPPSPTAIPHQDSTALHRHRLRTAPSTGRAEHGPCPQSSQHLGGVGGEAGKWDNILSEDSQHSVYGSPVSRGVTTSLSSPATLLSLQEFEDQVERSEREGEGRGMGDTRGSDSHPNIPPHSPNASEEMDIISLHHTHLTPASNLSSPLSISQMSTNPQSLSPPVSSSSLFVDILSEAVIIEQLGGMVSSLGLTGWVSAVHSRCEHFSETCSPTPHANHGSLIHRLATELRLAPDVITTLKRVFSPQTVRSPQNPLYNFNAFTFHSHCRQMGLATTLLYLFSYLDVFHALPGLPFAAVKHFLSLVEESYAHSNPYHNATHALDMVVSLFCLLVEKDLLELCTPVELFAVFIAAACHDIQHPAVSNLFLITSHHPLSLLYHSKGVLENFHLSAAFTLLNGTEFSGNHAFTSPFSPLTQAATAPPPTGVGLLGYLTHSEVAVVQKIVTETILATDMSQHFSMIGDFSRQIEKSDHENLYDFDTRLSRLCLAFKLADIAHSLRDPPITSAWTRSINEEFFAQGDLEKELGLPISPFMDRNLQDIPRGQVSFLEFVVGPLIRAWHILDPDPHHTHALHRNTTFWKSHNKDSFFIPEPS